MIEHTSSYDFVNKYLTSKKRSSLVHKTMNTTTSPRHVHRNQAL